MRRLSRYVLSSFNRIFLLALAAFVGLYLLVDCFENIDNFINQGAGLVMTVGYFACKIPLILGQVMPMAVLMASFMTIGGFSRTSELTAMRAAGMSLGRIALPMLLASAVLALALLALEQTLLPLSAQASREIWAQAIKQQPSLDQRQQDVWLREGNKILHFDLADADNGRLYGVEVIRLDPEFRIVERLQARQARFDQATGWQLERVRLRRFDPVSGALTAEETVAARPLALALTPEDFREAMANPRELPLTQHYALQQRFQREGRAPQRLQVDLQARLAAPFACLVMAFLGVPFALQQGRRSSLATGLAVSVSVGIGFYILNAIMTAIGYKGVLPPTVAAWAPDLLFLLLGIWLLLNTRE